MFGNLRTVCFITGAGAGLGRCLSQRFAKELPCGSVIVLVGRRASNIEETKKIVENSNASVSLRTVLADLASCTEASLRSSFAPLFSELKDKHQEFEQVIIIHNAGSVGDISKHQLELSDALTLQEYWHLSLTSVIVMNSLLLNEFAGDHVQNKIVVNISSLLAIQPFQSMSLYSAGECQQRFILCLLKFFCYNLRLMTMIRIV
jgi:sepiapterin reductase